MLTKAQEATIAELVALGVDAAKIEKYKADCISKNAAGLERITSNREVFSIQVNQYGVLVFRGLGNRFPTGLRVDSVETFLNQAEVIRKFIADNKALIETNSKNPRPRKIKAKLSVAK